PPWTTGRSWRWGCARRAAPPPAGGGPVPAGGPRTHPATARRSGCACRSRPPLRPATVEQLHVLVSVQLEVPVGVGREPVVVAAVEHHGVVVGDAALGQQLLEADLVHE